jgi:hypothetical protein
VEYPEELVKIRVRQMFLRHANVARATEPIKAAFAEVTSSPG